MTRIETAIIQSIDECRIVRIDETPDSPEWSALVDDLLAECDDSAESHTELEFWGEHEGNDWRIHVPRS